MMNELSDISLLSDAAILRQIGEFIKFTRINQQLTQDDLAAKAALSRSTISLLERGENIALGNLLKVLRMLDMLYVFDHFKVPNIISPILLAREDEKRRKRASRGAATKRQQ